MVHPCQKNETRKFTTKHQETTSVPTEVRPDISSLDIVIGDGAKGRQNSE
jgi:hypothetical protein